MGYLHNSFSARLSRLTRGFLFIPLALAIAGGCLGIVTNVVDGPAQMVADVPLLAFLDIDADGARSVLSTIAGAMMSVISLVYSLTLVVFTLAAGNIGPRLLETFANNRVNQITIGLLGATFLYSLITLYQIDGESAPRVSVAIAIFMATTSMFWLIYFVNDVAGRIMVDNEIGRIQKSLRKAIDTHLADDPRESDDDEKAIPSGTGTPMRTHRSGYITAITADNIAKMAEREDVFVEVLVKPGHFVIDQQPIAKVYGALKTPETFEKELDESIITDYARAPEGDLQFSVHLSVEIALRALSPGVNDSYTAISAIDHLSASLSRILRRGAPSPLITDKDDKPRVWLEVLRLSDILTAALNPLRQNACGNTLVTLRLINAIGRMGLVSKEAHRPMLRNHLFRITQDSNRLTRSVADRQTLARAVRAARSNFKDYVLDTEDKSKTKPDSEKPAQEKAGKAKSAKTKKSK
ncbi:DUF2254 domain-containing protein [Roseibium limicola]|uniref:DUF2254 domain-containing protein n=1 Tax=Roseibium limicola TaxID=2816037 RepID=A0A939ERJ3_9HYPH|nr:DUF2254 domain-containing protein [Roseibium limicola]MBO0347354.1 DUF2254 domain-containing protein [Roseibium limicola]